MAVTLSCKDQDKTTDIFTLHNSHGMTATFTSYGARLMSLMAPDKNGRLINVVWGFDKTASYQHCRDPYYGAIIGRYWNRIAKGKFVLDGKAYRLDINDGPNSLHGGKGGFHTKTWQTEQPNGHTVNFIYQSKDGEGGYQGNLKVKVTYNLTEDNTLRIAYEAETDKPTVLNLTNHAFWNLNGPGSGNILRHVLKIKADRFLSVDSTLIPTGRLNSVGGTPLDFRKGRQISILIGDHHPQLSNGRGYDHNFVLNPHGKNTPVAEVIGDLSGIQMQVFTDQPGLQFYSGNFMAGHNIMNGGARDTYRSGFCLETQHFPDSPNNPGFPSTVLKPGQTYRSQTIYKFSVN